MRWLRWLGALVLLGVSLGILAWSFRLQILLNVPRIVADIVSPIGPNQPITWARGPDSAPGGERPPNIVLILADDMGFNDVTLHGGVAGGTVPTPNIDALAAQGVQFTNGYAGNAICSTSRAMIMTGRYSTRFGFEYTPAPKAMATLAPLFFEGSDRLRVPIIDSEAASRAPAFAELGMRSSEITIAELLKTRGYHTVHIGKWHLGRSEGMTPRDQGFDESLLMASGMYLPRDHPDAVNARQDFDPIDAFIWANFRFAASFNDSEVFEPGGYLTDWWTDEALAAIEANRNRPFFLYLAHWAPHTPLQALRDDYEALSHIDDHTLRVYAAMVKSVDRSVARVMAALEEHGLADNTLVFFTSDNGGANYIGLPDINRPYRGWKLTLFEGGTHVPFVARWPGHIPAGVKYTEPVGHIDLFATAAAAAGAPLPDDRVIDGVDFVPYVRGEVEGPPHDVLFWRQGFYQVALAGGWKLQKNGDHDTWLFDLNSDPTEQRDIAAQNPDRVAELEALLAAHNAEQEPPAWPSFIRMPVAIDKTLAEPESSDDVFIWWPN